MYITTQANEKFHFCFCAKKWRKQILGDSIIGACDLIKKDGKDNTWYKSWRMTRIHVDKGGETGGGGKVIVNTGIGGV